MSGEIGNQNPTSARILPLLGRPLPPGREDRAAGNGPREPLLDSAGTWRFGARRDFLGIEQTPRRGPSDRPQIQGDAAFSYGDGAGATGGGRPSPLRGTPTAGPLRSDDAGGMEAEAACTRTYGELLVGACTLWRR